MGRSPTWCWARARKCAAMAWPAAASWNCRQTRSWSAKPIPHRKVPCSWEATSSNKGFSSYSLLGKQGVTVADGTQVDVRMPVLRVVDNEKLALWTPEQVHGKRAQGHLDAAQGRQPGPAGGRCPVRCGRHGRRRTAGRQGRRGERRCGPVHQAVQRGPADGGRALERLGRQDQPGRRGRRRRMCPKPWKRPAMAVPCGSARTPCSTSPRAPSRPRMRRAGATARWSMAAASSSAARSTMRRAARRRPACLSSCATAPCWTLPARMPCSDVNGAAVDVASAGGSIALASNNGLYLDGQLLARAGGAGAAGGSLSVATGTPEYLKVLATDKVLQGRQLALTQRQGASDLAEQRERTGRGGNAAVRPRPFFRGAGGSGRLRQPGPAGRRLLRWRRVAESAAKLPAVRRARADTRQQARREGQHRGAVRAPGQHQAGRTRFLCHARHGGASRRSPARSALTGDLIDVRGLVNIVADDVRLFSRGDLRFLLSPLGWDGDQPTTVLSTPGDMTLSAAQLYPETGAGAAVRVGYGRTDGAFGYDPARSLRIARTTDGVPAMPYSAFGSLELEAAHIEQGGVVRAPLGRLSIGAARYDNDKSLTRQSAGRQHQLRQRRRPGHAVWRHGRWPELERGWQVDLPSWAWAASVRRAACASAWKWPAWPCDVQPGALLDLSGGGELTGAGFIAGRGGSTDARTHPLVQVGANGGFVLPGLATNPVYAIVPGVQTPQAPGVAKGRCRCGRRPAGDDRQRRAGLAGRHLHPDAVDLCLAAGRLPRGTERPGGPGQRRYAGAAAAQRFLGRARHPVDRRHGHPRAAGQPADTHAGQGLAHVFPVQRNGLCRVCPGRCANARHSPRDAAVRCENAQADPGARRRPGDVPVPGHRQVRRGRGRLWRHRGAGVEQCLHWRD